VEADFSSRGFLLALLADLVHGEAAFGNHLLEGNAAFRVLPEVVARSGDGAAVRFSQFLAVLIEGHHFEQFGDGVELAGAELVEQLVGVLSVRHSALQGKPFLRVAPMAAKELISRMTAR